MRKQDADLLVNVTNRLMNEQLYEDINFMGWHEKMLQVSREEYMLLMRFDHVAKFDKRYSWNNRTQICYEGVINFVSFLKKRVQDDAIVAYFVECPNLHEFKQIVDVMTSNYKRHSLPKEQHHERL